MPAPRSSHLATVALLGVGTALWAYGAHRLSPADGMRFKPNPLGLKMSPYGQVIGMAMQGPIDLFWHEGGSHDHDQEHAHHEHDASCAHEHRSDGQCPDCAGHHGEHAAECPAAADQIAAAPQSPREQVKNGLRALGAGVNRRTNPHASTAAHKLYLRRQVENRLRMAYEFDPSNYGTYNAYHLFLTEAALATREHTQQKVLQLANWTIAYCLRETHDPRPSLTAAAAAHDILTASFGSQPRQSRDYHDQVLATLDSALARHLRLLRERQADGALELISATRRAEMAERFSLLVKLRDADEATIRRIFGQPAAQQASNTNPPSDS